MIDYDINVMLSLGSLYPDTLQCITIKQFKNSSQIKKLNKLINSNNLDNSINSKNLIDTNISKDIEGIEKVIDEIWIRIEKNHRDFLDFDLTDILRTLKKDILMSLYVTFKYNSIPPISRKEMDEAISKNDPASENEDSVKNSKQNKSHKRAALNQTFPTDDNSILIFMQLLDNNGLTYLKQYWDKTTDNIKCFDIATYEKYIRASSCWPFLPQNSFGMKFFDYFKGIRDMAGFTPAELYSKNSITQNSLNQNITFYLLEELFSPISFIKNLILHLDTFQQIFGKYKFPEREQSMYLMIPLFKIPISLWDTVAVKYISLTKKFIDEPANYKASLEFFSYLESIIFYSQYVFPLTKSIIGSALYQIAENNSKTACYILEKYIDKNIMDFGYASLFKDSIRKLATYTYPGTKNKIPVDIAGNFLYQAEKPEEYPDIKNKKKSKGDDQKRNKTAIRSYEINFTYNFFHAKKLLDLLSWFHTYRNKNSRNYCRHVIDTYWNDYLALPNNATCTYNYMRYQAINLGLKPGTMV